MFDSEGMIISDETTQTAKLRETLDVILTHTPDGEKTHKDLFDSLKDEFRNVWQIELTEKDFSDILTDVKKWVKYITADSFTFTNEGKKFELGSGVKVTYEHELAFWFMMKFADDNDMPTERVFNEIGIKAIPEWIIEKLAEENSPLLDSTKPHASTYAINFHRYVGLID